MLTLPLCASYAEPTAQRAVSFAGDTTRTNISWQDAMPILRVLRRDLLPVELQSERLQDVESLWPDWVSRRDAEIRVRLARGDEDSVVNFLLFGVTFTAAPRVAERDVLNGLSAETVERRIGDLAAAVESPGDNERLRFARKVIERNGIHIAAGIGREQVREYLRQRVARFTDDAQRVDREIRAKVGLVSADPDRKGALGLTVFRDRGLSSDTSLLVNFAIDETLQALKSEEKLGGGSIRRVAILGPGLDFTDKREGYDFYPEQTIQPFAIVDSLLGLGLAKESDLKVVTFDLSPRVNDHLAAARRRADSGGEYVLHLVRDPYQWSPGLVSYWERFGSSVGTTVKAVQVPSGLPEVQIRAVSVRPSIVRSILPMDLNVVLQRLEGLVAEERFDLIIGTNVFVYYDVFEQSLALANIAKMLRSRGWLLTNSPLLELPPIPVTSMGFLEVVYNDRTGGDDRIELYQRQ